MIIPWGYTQKIHKNRDRMARLAFKMVNWIKWYSSDKELYVPGTAYQVFDRWGLAGGATDDWYSSLGNHDV